MEFVFHDDHCESLNTTRNHLGTTENHYHGLISEGPFEVIGVNGGHGLHSGLIGKATEGIWGL